MSTKFRDNFHNSEKVPTSPFSHNLRMIVSRFLIVKVCAFNKARVLVEAFFGHFHETNTGDNPGVTIILVTIILQYAVAV